MEADLVIRNGTLVPGDGTVVEGLGIAIQGDRIAAVCTTDALPPARRVIDAAGKHVVPGFIDPHVHTRAPGYEYKEDFETCSAAAVAGGVTSFLAMFNVKPPLISEENLRFFIEYGQAHSMVNFNVHCLVIETNYDEIPKMAAMGISAIKFLMGYKFDVSGSGGRPDVKGLACPSDGLMLDAMRVIADTGVVLSAHAENEDIISRRQQQLKAQGRMDALAHLEARPNVAEEEAISRLIVYTRTCGNKLHILHLPGREGVALVRRAQEEGLRVTAETCPQYLLLTHEEHLAKVGSVAKINPPIRSQADQDALWEGIRLGGVDVIGTDHSPHTDEEKMVDRPQADIWKAMAGFVGVETVVPLMLTSVNQGRLSLARMVELCSTRPASLFGLYPERGVLRPGSAADVTIVDLKQTSVIDRRTLHSKTTVTPFDGWPVQGMPTHTIVNGTVAYENGRVLGTPGQGRYIPAHHTR